MPRKQDKASSSGQGGYRNPPEHSRFQKGQSGNPTGRPKGSRNFATLIEEELDEVLTLNQGGKRKRLTKRQIIAKKLVHEAAQGNPRAWAHLFAMTGRIAADPDELDGATAAMIASFLLRHAEKPDEPASGTS